MTHAFAFMPRPDWASATIVAVPGAAGHDAATWARTIFDFRSTPGVVKALMTMREGAVRLLRIPPADSSMLEVATVIDGQAIIDTDDAHLRFVAAISVEDDRVEVLTLVHLKGWRGRLYFAPVRLLHDAVTRAMINGAARRLAD